MLAKLGERFASVFRATAPDPFVLAILLTVLTYLLSVWRLAADSASPSSAWTQVLDLWQGPDGFWSLLAFGMQMSLILVTGHALAASPPIAKALRAVSAIPRGPRSAVAMVSALAIVGCLINWGLGLIVGALLARDVADAMRRRGVHVSRALLAAAGYTGMMAWHGGLSGSAPLDAADPSALAARLGPELAAHYPEGVPLSESTGSALNLITTLGLLALVPVTFMLLCPKGNTPIAPEAPPPRAPPPDPTDKPGRIPAFLERSPIVAWILALPMVLWLAPRYLEQGLDALNLNTANLTFLALGLILHANPMRYALAIEDAAKGCAGIILQFPLYGGIIGMLKGSGLAASVSEWFVRASGGGEAGLSVMTFLSAGLVNLLVPSGGGQWAVQAPIALGAAADAGVAPGKMVMAVAYGDQLTNMLQPFWALPLLAITRTRARDIVGYTAFAMIIGGAWIALCLAIV